MTTSAKKRKEKKKDFQKSKLRVGKEKAKNANFTDTSFKAKSIVLNQQSLSSIEPSLSTQFSHHLSLLTHKAESQRRDSLAYLTSTIESRPNGAPLPQPVAAILPRIQPLVLDGARNVRNQLLSLLKALPAGEVSNHAEQLLLFARAGMTHLSADIRSSSLDILAWLIRVAGEDVVSCPGGWVKTLKCFLSLFNWRSDATGKWTVATRTTFSKTDSSTKVMTKQLSTLAALLRSGFAQPAPSGLTRSVKLETSFPLHHAPFHLEMQRANPFAHLNIFGEPRDDETQMYEDVEDRQGIFQDMFRGAMSLGLEYAKKEEGEVGRAAAQVQKIIDDGMKGFNRL